MLSETFAIREDVLTWNKSITIDPREPVRLMRVKYTKITDHVVVYSILSNRLRYDVRKFLLFFRVV